MMIVITFDASPAPDAAAVIDALQAAFGPVTATRLEFAAPVTPVPQWWEGLAMKASLVTKYETPVYYQPGLNVRNRVPAGTPMEYWGKARGGYLCVYVGSFELWVAADAVQPV